MQHHRAQIHLVQSLEAAPKADTWLLSNDQKKYLTDAPKVVEG